MLGFKPKLNAMNIRKPALIGFAILLLLIVALQLDYRVLLLASLVLSLSETLALLLIGRFNAFEAVIFSSTIAIVAIILMALVLGPLHPTGVAAFLLLLLMLVSNALVRRARNLNSKTVETLDLTHLAIATVMFIVAGVSARIPRTYISDETSYAYAVQLIESHDTTFTFNYPLESSTQKYLGSRILWIGYLYAVNSLLGLAPTELHAATSLFVALMLPVVMGILYDIYGVHNMKHLFLLGMYVTLSPIIVLWSLTILVDVPESYFLLSQVYLLANSIDFEKAPKVESLRLSMALFYLLLDVLFLRGNVLFPTLLFLLLLVHLFFCSKRQRVSKTTRITIIFFKVLVALAVLLLAVDLAYFISVHVLRDAQLALKIRPFLIYRTSIVETFVGWFVSYPWKPQTIFSYSVSEWINWVNTAASPELIGLVAASIPLFPLPLLLRKDISELAKLLIASSIIAFWIYIFNLVLSSNFHDINRYCLPLYVLFTIFAVVDVYTPPISTKHLLLFLFGLLVPLLVNVKSNLDYGGTRFFWVMNPYPYSSRLLVLEFMIVICLLLVSWKLMSRVNFSVSSILFGKKCAHTEVKIGPGHFLACALVTISIISILFSYTVINNSTTLFSNRSLQLEEVASHIRMLGDRGLSKVYVVSNFHMNLRNYLNPSQAVVIPMPLDFTEFYKLIQVLPGEVVVAITDDDYLSYSSFINKNLSRIIPLNDFRVSNSTVLRRNYLTWWDKYSYVVFIRKKLNTSTQIQDTEISLEWDWRDRSCIVRTNKVSNGTIILSTVKFTKIISLNNSYYAFPYIDKTTKLNMAYLVCYLTNFIGNDTRYYGFSIVNRFEVFILLALAETTLIIFVLAGRKHIRA